MVPVGPCKQWVTAAAADNIANTACVAAAAVCVQEGMLPIHFAAMFNRLDVVAMLLDRGSRLQPPPAKKVCMRS
jgi:ankyrin repeat protein